MNPLARSDEGAHLRNVAIPVGWFRDRHIRMSRAVDKEIRELIGDAVSKDAKIVMTHRPIDQDVLVVQFEHPSFPPVLGYDIIPLMLLGPDHGA